MNGHGNTVMLLSTADEARQRVGPYAWVVLEHLAGRADPMASDTAVETSIRDIASHLAISKDTVTRSLRRLIDANLVEREVDRNDTTGQFGNAAYRVHLERAGLRVVANGDASVERPAPGQPPRTPKEPRRRSVPPKAPRRRPTSSRADVAQLNLFDALGESDS